jgi:m7GpppX diphosphatase
MMELNDEERASVTELVSRCKADACVLVLTFRGFDKSVSSKVPSIEVSRFQANHPFSSFNLVGGLSPADLSVGAEVIWPADPRSISKYTFTPATLVTETPAAYAAAHVPFIESQIARPFHLNWVHAILDLKKETDTMLLMDRHPDTGFVVHPDTKWVTFKQVQAIVPAIDNLGMDGAVVGSFGMQDAELVVSPRKDLCKPYAADATAPALPFEMIRAMHMLVLTNRRDVRCLRDLTAEHLPMLRNIRAGVRYLAAAKFGIPASDVLLYMHYAPTFYHLHVHVNHVANYEATPAAKTVLLDDVIANLELDGGYYAKATLTFRAPAGPLVQAIRASGL